MQIKPKANCPLNGFAPCKELDCGWFVQLRGKHPQSEQDFDEWGCAVAWLPVLLCENAQMTRQTGAAVESFRNEMAQPGNNAIAALLYATQKLQQTVANQNANIFPALISAMAAKANRPALNLSTEIEP